MTQVIELDSGTVERAKWIAQRIYEKVRGRPNYTGLNEPARYEVGYLGEFAVWQWMALEGIAFSYSVDSSGTSQKSEFNLDGVGRLEVKTGSLPTHRHFMMPAAQAFDFEIAVGVRLDGTKASIMGWLGRKDTDRLELVQLKIPTRRIEYGRMRSAETLPPLVRRLQS